MDAITPILLGGGMIILLFVGFAFFKNMAGTNAQWNNIKRKLTTSWNWIARPISPRGIIGGHLRWLSAPKRWTKQTVRKLKSPFTKKWDSHKCKKKIKKQHTKYFGIRSTPISRKRKLIENIDNLHKIGNAAANISDKQHNLQAFYEYLNALRTVIEGFNEEEIMAIINIYGLFEELIKYLEEEIELSHKMNFTLTQTMNGNLAFKTITKNTLIYLTDYIKEAAQRIDYENKLLEAMNSNINTEEGKIAYEFNQKNIIIPQTAGGIFDVILKEYEAETKQMYDNLKIEKDKAKKKGIEMELKNLKKEHYKFSKIKKYFNEMDMQLGEALGKLNYEYEYFSQTRQDISELENLNQQKIQLLNNNMPDQNYAEYYNTPQYQNRLSPYTVAGEQTYHSLLETYKTKIDEITQKLRKLLEADETITNATMKAMKSMLLILNESNTEIKSKGVLRWFGIKKGKLNVKQWFTGNQAKKIKEEEKEEKTRKNILKSFYSFIFNIKGEIKEKEQDIKTGEKPVKNINCPKCKNSNPADSKFCENCGIPLIKKITCPKCKISKETTENIPENAICPKCNTKLEIETATKMEKEKIKPEKIKAPRIEESIKGFFETIRDADARDIRASEVADNIKAIKLETNELKQAINKNKELIKTLLKSDKKDITTEILEKIGYMPDEITRQFK